MGVIDGFLFDGQVALSTLHARDIKTALTAVAITAVVISITISLIRKHRSQSLAAIFLESHVVGMALEKKGSWLWKLLINPKAVIHGMSSSRAIIVEPALGQTILRRPHEVLDNDPMHWALQTRVFGAREALYSTVAPLTRSLFGAVSKSLLSETAVRPVVRATNILLGEKIIDFVPSTTQIGPVSHAEIETRPWLRDVEASVDSDGAVELDLYLTIRDFTMYISTCILAGNDLMKQYPDITSDLFTLDAGFGPLGLGFPTWFPLGLIRRAVAARKRIIAGLAAFGERLDAVATGTADEALVERMKDVSQMWYDRSALYRTVDLSFADRGAMDVSLLWAMNANTSPAVFWMVAYLVTHPDAVAAVRAEVAPYVGVATASATEPATVDVDGIVTKCPRLKACLLETMRIASEPSSIRHIGQDFTVAHPSSKAPLSFRRGGHVILPHTVHHRDGAAFPEPHAFHPERFLVRVSDDDDDDDPKPVASMREPDPVRAAPGSLKPWGDGPLICKGRLFAEREMLVEVALLVSVWDMTPLEPGVPNHLVGTGVVKPDRPMRVKVRRRVVDA